MFCKKNYGLIAVFIVLGFYVLFYYLANDSPSLYFSILLLSLIVRPSVLVSEVLAPETEDAVIDIAEGHIVGVGREFFSIIIKGGVEIQVVLLCVVDGLCLQRKGVFYIYTERQIFIIGSSLHYRHLYPYTSTG